MCVFLSPEIGGNLAPAILLFLGIVILFVAVDATTITFVMLAVVPCAVIWWLVGWEPAVACAAAYVIFRAVRRVHLMGMSRSKPHA
jgi:hypothetical protein